MPKVLVVYHSASGNTARMAEAVAEGAKISGVEVELKKVKDTTLADLQDSDGIIMGSPTYYGQMSSQLKHIFDISFPIRGELEDKVGAAFTSSGSPVGGGQTTLISIILSMLIHGMIIVGDPIESGGHYGASAVGKPDEEELYTCKMLGERVGKLVQQLKPK